MHPLCVSAKNGLTSTPSPYRDLTVISKHLDWSVFSVVVADADNRGV